MPADPMPAAEVAIDEPLVRTLLADQHPDLAGLPLTDPVFGWDNVMFRLGNGLMVRLPRRAQSAVLVEHEQRWLPRLAASLPLPVPAPVRVGRAALGYPWSWSVCPWLPGEPASTCPSVDPVDAAVALGGFLAALHREAPADAPTNRLRGVPLSMRSELFFTAVGRLDSPEARSRATSLWHQIVATPPWTGPQVWLHGDLHPSNVLVRDGRIAAVIDFGDITSGDPATDLAVAWMMLPTGVRDTLRAAAGPVDDDTWRRARGWALALAVAILSRSGDNRVMHQVATRTLDAVLEEG